MEANDTVSSKDIVDDMLKDSEETEVPLGRILKRLKEAKGAKERKAAVKNGSTEPAAETNNNNNNNNNNNVDILEMVKEINLDNLGVPNKFVSINGHEETKTDEKHKRKRIPTEKMKISVTKRQRSKSQGLSAFDNIKLGDENKPSTRPSDLDGIGHIQIKEHENTDDGDLHKPNKYTDTDGNKKSGSVRKRKRRSVAGLAKGTSKEGESHTTDLIGRRIKVWWPMDKDFYEGLVKSYDHQKKKHVVLYNDGDVEVISLDKERWELIANTPKPTKRNRLSKSPHAKRGSSKKKMKGLVDSKKVKELTKISPSSTVRGKRTPTKNTKQSRKGVTQRTLEYLEVERKQDLEATPEPEPESEAESEHGHEYATFSKVDTLDTEEDSDREEAKDTENRLSDPESSMEIEPDSGQKETQNESGSDQVKEEKQSPSSASEKSDDDEELSDNMPLGVWKTQIRKTDESK